MGTHAVGCAVELAREFLHQQVMIPAGVVAFNMVPSAIERVGNGPHYHRRGPLPRDGRDKPRCRASSLAHGGRRSHKIGRDQSRENRRDRGVSGFAGDQEAPAIDDVGKRTGRDRDQKHR